MKIIQHEHEKKHWAYARIFTCQVCEASFSPTEPADFRMMATDNRVRMTCPCCNIPATFSKSDGKRMGDPQAWREKAGA